MYLTRQDTPALNRYLGRERTGTAEGQQAPGVKGGDGKPHTRNVEPWTLWLGLDQHGGRCPSVRRELDREGAKLEQRWREDWERGTKSFVESLRED